MSKGIEEILVADNAAEDALVVAEQNEGHLAGDGYGGAQLEAAAEDVEVKHLGNRKV